MTADEEFFDLRIADNELQKLFNKKLKGFMSQINEKELKILEKRILSEVPKTLVEIGKEYGITKERVRQIENRLKNKIREYMKEEIPDFDNLDASFEEKDD